MSDLHFECEKIPFEQSMGARLLSSMLCHSEKIFLRVGHESVTYQTLYQKASALAATLQSHSGQTVAIFSTRNFTAYLAITAVLLSGKSYLPLIADSDPEVNLRHLAGLDTQIIIAEASLLEHLASMVEDSDSKLWVLLPGLKRASVQAKLYPHVVTVCQDEFVEQYIPPPSSSPYVYKIFTSGTTSKPKCVAVSHHNLITYINNFIQHCHPSSADRFSQINPLCFDFSVHEIFVALSIGACLCVITPPDMTHLVDIIHHYQLTYLSILPSMIACFARLNDDGVTLSSLRHTMFCGEALSDTIARIWSSLAPNSLIDNFYGPTEATVAVSHFRWTQDNAHACVPIGRPWQHSHIKLLDKDLQQVSLGDVGDIWIGGCQLADVQRGMSLESGSEKYKTINGRKWYCTGDLAYLEPSLGYVYCGRSDDQFKIRGRRVNRVELEQAIQCHLSWGSVALVLIRRDALDRAVDCIAFVESMIHETTIAQRRLNCLLDAHYLPVEVHSIPCFLLTDNGKVDYRRLKSCYLLWKTLFIKGRSRGDA